MNTKQLFLTYQAIDNWCEGNGTIDYICQLLGDKNHDLHAMLLDNGLLGANNRPTPDLPKKQIIDCILLYLAMRHA